MSELLRARKSCRDFTSQRIERDVLDDILRDAMQSPSWSNTQPYRLAIAEGEVKDQLSADFKRRYEKAARIQGGSKLRQLCAFLTGNEGFPKSDYKQALVYPPELQQRRLVTAKGLYSLLNIAREDRDKRDQQMARNFEFFGAPTAIFIFTHKGLGAYSVLDAGILLQSIMLAAEARGVASCAQGALAVWRSPLDKHFKVPKDYKLLCGVSLGYASDHIVNQYTPARIPAEQLLVDLK